MYDAIRSNIDKGVYNNKETYPKNKPLQPRLSKDSKFYAKVVEEYKINLDEYREAQVKFREGGIKAMAAFKNDIIKMVMEDGVSFKQAEKVYDKAWERGHSSGLVEVLNCADDLMDLFRE